MVKFKLIKVDITRLKVDAIVNAANNSLLGGGGVDGAIHRAAGPGLLVECKTLNGCATGDAKVTSGYNLLAKFVIHTVGPVWHGGTQHEDELLASCYKNCLLIAKNLKLNTIAFPNISTGIYGFPKKKAVDIVFQTILDTIKNADFLQEIIFVCFDDENYDLYSRYIALFR